MPTYHVAVRIASPADFVWEHISNVVRWPDWLPTVSSVTPLDASALQLGSRFRVAQPKLRPAVWQVTDVQPGHSFVWQARAVGLVMWANHVVNPAGASACDLTLAFRFSGIISPLVAFFAGPLTQRYIETEAASLKKLAQKSHRDCSCKQRDLTPNDRLVYRTLPRNI